jgi:pyridoxal phosphate enzyme (YggS family)
MLKWNIPKPFLIDMDNMETNLKEIQQRIDQACARSNRIRDEITMVAVTKTLTADIIRTAYKYGIKDFGENRVQEASVKINELADLRSDIAWHMIGHIQTNKAKVTADIFDIIHSVDSVKLARILSESSQKTLPILIQLNVAGEGTKEGFAPEQIDKALEEIRRFPNLEIKGLMTIAPWTDDAEDARPVFKKLRQIRDRLGLEHLSMGMTDDFEVAIEEGATIIRIGRAVFGNRRT